MVFTTAMLMPVRTMEFSPFDPTNTAAVKTIYMLVDKIFLYSPVLWCTTLNLALDCE